MTHAVIVIDLQIDFCPGGRLAVAGADAIVPAVNRLMDEAGAVVLTQDWHPAHHSSFAANHPGTAPFDTVQMPYGPQVLWPVHCIIGSAGAGFHPGLDMHRADLVLRKGFRPDIDSYSAFFENDRATPTGLAGYLRDRGVTDLVLAGLALDFCVAWSALDAVRLGFRCAVAQDACRAIDLNGSRARALSDLQAAGVDITG